VFLVAALTLYGPALGLGLLSDDYTLLAMAQSDGLGAGSGWFFRPLPLLLWRALFAISHSAVLLHIVNVLLHGLNAFLVGTLGRAMGMRRVALSGAACPTASRRPEEASCGRPSGRLMTTMVLARWWRLEPRHRAAGVSPPLACWHPRSGIEGAAHHHSASSPSLDVALTSSALAAWRPASRCGRAGVYLAIRVPMGRW
jgi:hypothetical protein